AAAMGATLLALACAGLVMPAVYYYLLVPAPGRPAAGGMEPTAASGFTFLSEEIAGILAGIYLLSLVFSLVTHRHLFAGPEEQLPKSGAHHQPEWGRTASLVVLVVATAGVAWMSELLAGTVEHAGEALGLTQLFLGVIVLAVVGNAAEHSTAVLMAMKNKMDLAVHIAIGSGIQIALFVAPILVFASMLMGHDRPLDLHFHPLELATVILAVAIVALISQDGETHWMEGVMLLGVYVILAMAFFHLPQEATGVGESP
ncbi:MAG TPA: calcium/proton exchanger, partial [Gemmataceae bacterium]|nr:calcium/proton exchanger [Gemmataceae bacterium]